MRLPPHIVSDTKWVVTRGRVNFPMPGRLLNDAKHWRERAEEARAVAATLNDPEAEQMMLEIAESYEMLAQLAEQRAADKPD